MVYTHIVVVLPNMSIGKAIPIQALRVQRGWNFQTSRQSAHESGKVSSLKHQPPSPPRKCYCVSGTDFCFRLSGTQCHSADWRIMSKGNSNDLHMLELQINSSVYAEQTDKISKFKNVSFQWNRASGHNNNIANIFFISCIKKLQNFKNFTHLKWLTDLGMNSRQWFFLKHEPDSQIFILCSLPSPLKKFRPSCVCLVCMRRDKCSDIRPLQIHLTSLWMH